MNGPAPGLSVAGDGYRVVVSTSPRFQHVVVGAIHEVIVTTDDPEVLAEAVAHELHHCHALRIVVDITALEELEEAHLLAVSPLTEVPDRSAVRVTDDTYASLEPLLTRGGVRDVITDRSPGRRRRPEGLTGARLG